MIHQKQKWLSKVIKNSRLASVIGEFDLPRPKFFPFGVSLRWSPFCRVIFTVATGVRPLLAFTSVLILASILGFFGSVVIMVALILNHFYVFLCFLCFFKVWCFWCHNWCCQSESRETERKKSRRAHQSGRGPTYYTLHIFGLCG